MSKPDYEQNARQEVEVFLIFMAITFIAGLVVGSLLFIVLKDNEIGALKSAHSARIGAAKTVQSELLNSREVCLKNLGLLLSRIDVETDAKQLCISQLGSLRAQNMLNESCFDRALLSPCTAHYDYNGVSVCESEFVGMCGAGGFYSPKADRIIIESSATNKAALLAHEYCHKRQQMEGRAYDETECRGVEQ